MATSKNIAKHFKEFYFGVNWTWSNVKDALKDVTWRQATTQVHSFNTIATLAYHIHYFVLAATDVLQGRPLVAKDKFSFNHPPINSQEDWENFQNSMWSEAKVFIELIEKLPDDTLWTIFADEKYGIYYRNLNGIIEHGHYHLGQISLIKKILAEQSV